MNVPKMVLCGFEWVGHIESYFYNSKLYMIKSPFYLLTDFLNFWFLPLYFLNSEISFLLLCK